METNSIKTRNSIKIGKAFVERQTLLVLYRPHIISELVAGRNTMTLENPFPRSKTSVGGREFTQNGWKSSEGSECGRVVSAAFCLISWQRKSYRSKTLNTPTVEHLWQSTRKHVKQISPVKMNNLEISVTSLT